MAVEEPQSLNEELQSMNEELQSSNEELEVSKEEVESLNEELRSVNVELEARVSELSEANDDLKNLLDSTQIATLFLDEDLRVKRFTETARNLIALRETDVGRPVSEMSTDLRYQDLTADGEEVLRTLSPKEVEVQTHAGHWYLLRILPYRTTQNVIKGLVCTFQDIQSAKRLERGEAFFRAILETVREPLLVLDPDLRVVSANDSFYRAFPLTPAAVEGASLFELGEGQWDHPELRSLLEEVLPAQQSFRDFELAADFGEQGPARLLLNGRRLAKETEGETMILLAMDLAEAPTGTPGEADQ
ncbi:PAS domain-containing protein [Thiohalorhabdus sp.]|uniref:PAS domain-containing protein n=1 Tax=Thiohalorhabdus sp. TaxID=3094134 RepID=UPI002FC32478